MAHPHDPHAHQSFREEERVRHVGTGRYYVVWVALLVFTAITLVTAKAIHLPSPWGLLVALAIAFAKASLVALFFMHLWDHGGTNRLVLGAALVFLALLIGLTTLDNATRFQLTNPPNDRNLRAMPPGPDILSPMVEPRGGLAPEGPQRGHGGASGASGGSGGSGEGKPVRPTGSD